MAQRTINRFYGTYAEAVQVVADLTGLGIPPADIALIDSEDDARLPPEVAADTGQNPAATGATLGAAMGAGIGALDGIGAIVIPFTDLLTQTGWVLPCVVFAAIGAVLGAVIGKLIRFGATGKQSYALAAGLQSGQQLVMVRVDDATLPEVEAVMTKARSVPPVTPLPEPAFDSEYVPDNRTVAQEAAAIHREERRIQYE
jgi:hypothetical protein